MWYAFAVLSFDEALARILALGAPPLPLEHASIDAVAGRVLGNELIATADLPRFDYSSMDGYAMQASQLAAATQSSPARLVVRGESKTGDAAKALEPGTCMRIFTGAPLPEGADAVVMQERVIREGEHASFAEAPAVGQFVRHRGEDLTVGGIAIASGTRLRPAHLALAASLDCAELAVHRRPVVALLATGDELRRPGTEPRPGTVVESNTVALRAMAERAGATVSVFPFVPDERTATERAFAAALDDADVVVTIGGVSVGDHDLVRPALEAVGVVLDFWRVAIKPGKPLAVGRFQREGRREAIVLGLPGNPASAMVTFALFGIPLLRALQGDRAPLPPRLRARLRTHCTHSPGRLELARAVVHYEEGGLFVTPLGNQASGAATTMAESNALALLPADAERIPAGSEIDVLLMSDMGL